jgi:hypothetical protein
MMVPEGGTGSGTSAPSVNEIYKAIFGVEGSALIPSQAIIPGGTPITGLPTVNADGTIELPKDDGLPGSSESGIPAANTDDKKSKQNRRRRRAGSS